LSPFRVAARCAVADRGRTAGGGGAGLSRAAERTGPSGPSAGIAAGSGGSARPFDQALPDRLEAVTDASLIIYRRWYHNDFAGLVDQTRSGRDMSVFATLRRRGLADPDPAALMTSFRFGQKQNVRCSIGMHQNC
jgi:hypothetical protein